MANNINGIQPFNSFLKKKLIIQTPPRNICEFEEETRRNTAFNKTPSFKLKIINNLATIKTKNQGPESDSEVNKTLITETPYGLCDDFGINKLIGRNMSRVRVWGLSDIH